MPHSQRPLYSLILPAYNAAHLLDRTWPEVLKFVCANGGAWEAIYVCDGCSDGSDRELERRAAGLPADAAGLIRVVRYRRNRGKGYAVRLGMLRARGQYRIFTDVDLAYRLDMVQTLAEQLAAGLDVVIASRAHRESAIEMADGMGGYIKRRKLQSLVFSTLARLILGLRQRDPQAGLKGLSARAAVGILRYVRCYGFGFDCDLLVACRYLGIPVREVPVRVVYDEAPSTTKLSSSLRMIRELWAIRKRWRRIRREGLEENVLAAATPPANAQDAGEIVIPDDFSKDLAPPDA